MAIILFGIVTFLIVRNLRDPKIVLPTPTMPKPNAFDVYVKAAGQIVRNEEIAALSDSKTRGKYSLAQRESLLRANRAALATFRYGLTMDCRSVPVRTYFEKYPPYDKFREGARLMALESRVRAERGDAKGAADAGLDGVTMGKQIMIGSPLLGGLVGVACQAVGRRPVWDVIERLEAREARASLLRLEKMRRIKADYADLLTEERYYILGTMRDTFKDPNGAVMAWSGGEAETESDSEATLQAAANRLTIFFLGRQRIVDNLNQGIDDAIAYTRKPYAEAHNPPRLPGDLFSQTLLPVLYEARIKFVSNDTEDALLMTRIALHAYRLDKGKFPATLAALCPEYRERLPVDPFSHNEPLRYIAAKNLLYSIGPDGRDDGGTPIDNPGAKTEMARRVPNADSQGDIVAGILKQ